MKTIGLIVFGAVVAMVGFYLSQTVQSLESMESMPDLSDVPDWVFYTIGCFGYYLVAVVLGRHIYKKWYLSENKTIAYHGDAFFIPILGGVLWPLTLPVAFFFWGVKKDG